MRHTDADVRDNDASSHGCRSSRAADVCGGPSADLFRVPRRVFPRRDGARIYVYRRAGGAAQLGPSAGDAVPHLRGDVELHPPRGALLHLHGHHAGEVAPGGGPAYDDRAAVRGGARGARDRRRVRGGAAGRGHGRRGGVGRGDGAHFDARDAALRILRRAVLRCHYGGGHPRANHPAEHCADRAGRPARHQRGGPLHRGARAGRCPGEPLRPVRGRGGAPLARRGAGPARRHP
jgi:hypothetical protein